MRLYLASSSPRRRELLARLGLPFTVLPVKVDEAIDVNRPPGRLVETLAACKARAARVEEGLVIGADTIVVCGGRIFGKPRDAAEAISMLSSLQGTSHEVYTGVAVRRVEDEFLAVGHEVTTVKFRPATKWEIDLYVATGEPMDKAGAYAVQGLGAIFVDHIEGCFFNVVGLPLARLNTLMKECGADILSLRKDLIDRGGIPRDD
ncbi:MAG: Maf-like protein [Clostridia bacterium 62_21]|nr:MAG: Maf-like protein [Clostridia bacterium 62_21]